MTADTNIKAQLTWNFPVIYRKQQNSKKLRQILLRLIESGSSAQLVSSNMSSDSKDEDE